MLLRIDRRRFVAGIASVSYTHLYSFAIPESIVRKVVVDLKEYGIVQRALLGIRYGIVDQDFIDNMGEETGIKELGGAYVSSVVEGGSASEAGIRKGDVILDIDGVKINDNATLSEQIGRRRPNDKVKLSVKRDGKVKQIDVTLPVSYTHLTGWIISFLLLLQREP